MTTYNTDAKQTFRDRTAFVERLRMLHQQRHDGKLHIRRRSLSDRERKLVFEKTGGKCHICGGRIAKGDAWQADHVFSHCLGGKHSIDNYLPAHSLCNNYRWFYLSEEFQWIIKLGVWLRTEIKNETPIGCLAGESFMAHERKRAARTKTVRRG